MMLADPPCIEDLDPGTNQVGGFFGQLLDLILGKTAAALVDPRQQDQALQCGAYILVTGKEGDLDV